MTRDNLEVFKNDSLSHLNSHQLQELTEIYINPDALLEDRINMFLDKIGNPYLFKINDTIFRIKFSDNDKSLDDSIYSYLSNLIESDN